jgi:hypothetical protein
MHRVGRPIVAGLLALALVGGAAAPTIAKMPEGHQRHAWQRACERAAGTLSDQPALVCDHVSETPWDDTTVRKLVRYCERALGGDAVHRSQFPLELVACF